MPLYIISRDSYYRYMAFVKRGIVLLILSIAQWFSTTKIYEYGDQSVNGELKRVNGGVEHHFPSRMVLIANHQVSNIGATVCSASRLESLAIQRLGLPLEYSLHKQPLSAWRPVPHPQRLNKVHSHRRLRPTTGRLRVHVAKDEDRSPTTEPSYDPIETS